MYPILIRIPKTAIQRRGFGRLGTKIKRAGANNRAGAKVILSSTYSWGGIVPVPGNL